MKSDAWEASNHAFQAGDLVRLSMGSCWDRDDSDDAADDDS